MAKHSADFDVTKRGPDRKATEWGAWCSCTSTRADGFYGPTYEDVEDKWRKHVYETTGTLIDAWGRDKDSRWKP